MNPDFYTQFWSQHGDSTDESPASPRHFLVHFQKNLGATRPLQPIQTNPEKKQPLLKNLGIPCLVCIIGIVCFLGFCFELNRHFPKTTESIYAIV